MLILCWPALGKCRNGTISTFLSCWYYVEIMLRSCWPVPAPAALGKCKRGTISTFPSCWYYVDQCWRRLHWPKIKGGKILCSCWKFECVTCCVQNLGKNGVENFLQRHEKKLLEASTLGKIWVAASVLPAHYCFQARCLCQQLGLERNCWNSGSHFGTKSFNTPQDVRSLEKSA